MFVDSHCHLSKEDYEDIDKVVNNAKNAGVNYLIVSGYDIKHNEETIDITSKYDNVFLTLGYHPSEANVITDTDIDNLKEQIKSNKKVIAIGEIGLDYHWEKDNKEKQKELFKKQIELAKELNLPIVVHSRDAFQDTYDILKETNHRGVIHCFSGNIENAKMYASLGYCFGIGGVLTFKNTNLRETVKEMPIDRILLETDSPYLAPTPYRGEQNEPKYIPIIAEELAKVYDKTIEEIATITTRNVCDIFNIKID